MSDGTAKTIASWAPDYDVAENVSPFKPLPVLDLCCECGKALATLTAMAQVRSGRVIGPLCDACISDPDT